MKRFLSGMMTLILLLSLLPAALADDAVLYQSCLERLAAYLAPKASSNQTESVRELDSLYSNFMDMYSHEQSAFFSSYVNVLSKVETNDFDLAFMLIQQLRLSAKFDQYLQSDERFCTLDELESYVNARQCEYTNNQNGALQYYMKCIDYLDAFSRVKSLDSFKNESAYQTALEHFKRLEYEKAYELLVELAMIPYRESRGILESVKLAMGITNDGAAAAPPAEPENVPQAPPSTAETFTVKAYPGEKNISLKWSYSASSFEVYRRRGEDGAWERIGQTSNAFYVDNNASPNRRYYYYVVADGGKAKSEEVYSAATGAKAASVTNAPVTTAPERVWGPWLLSEAPMTANENLEVKPTTQYRYSDLKTTIEYGIWSEYSTSPLSASAVLEVDTKVEEQKEYNYSRYKYYHVESPNSPYYSYEDNHTQAYNIGHTGEMQHKTSSTPLAVVGVKDGHKKYQGAWYNEKVTTKSVTYYRSRPIITNSTWSSWSAWQDSNPGASATRQIDSRVVYLYRTR